jgi:hypothetical protein
MAVSIFTNHRYRVHRRGRHLYAEPPGARLNDGCNRIVNATLTLRGKANPKHLVDNLREIDGSLSVHLLDPDEWADGG